MRLATALPFRALLYLMFCLRAVFLVRSATCFPLPSVASLLLRPLPVVPLLLVLVLVLAVLLAVPEELDQLKIFQMEPLNI